MESMRPRAFDVGISRLLRRAAGIAVVCWLIWTGWFAWNWPVVLVGGSVFTLLAVAKNSYWSAQGRQKATDELARVNLPGWVLWSVIPFNLLFALVIHAATRAVSNFI